MLAVVEAVTSDWIRLIPDQKGETLYVSPPDFVSDLQVGDVVRVEVVADAYRITEVLLEERQRRIERSQALREKLLRRTQQRSQE